MFKTRAGLAIALAFGVLSASASAADLNEIKESGVLRVAVAPLSPFVIKDADGGFSGHDVEATRDLAEHIGVRVEYVETPFCELDESIFNGDADVIASGFSNMPTRRRLLDYSLPYHDTEYFVVVEKKAMKRAKTLKGLNRRDISIGYQIGGVSGMVAKGEFPGSRLEGFSSFGEILEAMDQGDVDGAVLFGPYIDMAKEIDGKNYRTPHEYALTRTIEAFAVSKESDAFLDLVNAWVIKQDLDGYWKALRKKWYKNRDGSARPPYACPSAMPAG